MELSSTVRTNEAIYCRAIFNKNIKKIQSNNNNPLNTYKMGVNQFTAYTEKEFSERFFNHWYQIVSSVEQIESNLNAVIVDWTTKGLVGPLRNQGLCGSGVLYSFLGGV